MTRTSRRLSLALGAVTAIGLLAICLPPAAAGSSASTLAGTTAVTSQVPSPASVAADPVVAADYSSIFADTSASLANAGWAACAAPITWSLDAGTLSADEVAREIENIQWALDQWAQSSGLAFTYVGRQELRYDDAAFTLTPADGSGLANRHIYLAFVTDAASDRMGGGTVGLGSPSQVFPTSKEIVNGAAVFRIDHVVKSGSTELRGLYLHELGHVMGLAHAAEQGNVMYPVVTDNIELGAGDVNGVQAMTKACAAA